MATWRHLGESLTGHGDHVTSDLKVQPTKDVRQGAKSVLRGMAELVLLPEVTQESFKKADWRGNVKDLRIHEWL